MTQLINEISKNIEVINAATKVINNTTNVKNKAIESVTDKINRLTYEECILLLDPLNDMPGYIYDAILNRLSALWRDREQCNH